jgi:tellurite resistance protein TehA-like permease
VRALKGVDAGSYTVVMATGVLGVGARLEGIAPLADVLLACACLAWLVLAVLLSRRAVSSFAVVAGTAVIGTDFSLAGQPALAVALWSLAAALWLAVVYTQRQAAADSLLFIVATESIAVLGASVTRRHEAPLLAVAWVAWLVGLAMYPLVAALVVRRSVRQRGFSPDLWIVMGALAITTLAGSELLLAHHRDWLRDADLATWALASAAIVPLVAAELRVRRWGYEGARWSFVFPLGMYGVASRVLGAAERLGPLRNVGTIFFWIALGAWVFTAIGLVRSRR